MTIQVDAAAVVRALLTDRVRAVYRADDLPDCLAALAELERAAAKARAQVAVRLVLDEGWSFAQLGRVLGISRQAAAKTYGPLVEEQMRRRIRSR